MRHKTFFVAMLALAAFSQAARAQHIVATIDNPPTLPANAHLSGEPIRVLASTPDGQCRFRLAFSGHIQGNALGKAMLGKIEAGVCEGRRITSGSAIGSVHVVDGRPTLQPAVAITPFN